MVAFNSRIVHPRMMRNLMPFFNSYCTVQQRIVTVNSFGEEIITYQDYEHLRGIQCYREPATGSEVRRPTDTITANQFIIALVGWFPDINQLDRVIVNQNLSYDIIKVASDDTRTITFLTAEIVNEDETKGNT